MSKSLGEFEQLILFALVELRDAAYGVTIREAIEARTGRDVSPGAVYTALERMTQRGYVSSRLGGTVPERGGRRKRFYALEPAGALALRDSYRVLSRMAEGLTARMDALASAAE